jgi:hypothetical protein
VDRHEDRVAPSMRDGASANQRSNNRLQQTALRAAAEPERWATPEPAGATKHRGFAALERMQHVSTKPAFAAPRHMAYTRFAASRSCETVEFHPWSYTRGK